MQKHTYLLLYIYQQQKKKIKAYTKLHTTPMPPQPQTVQENPLPRKRQAPLDDNGEPVTIPASKKKKSVEQARPKKKEPAKSQAKTKEKRTVSTTVSKAPVKRKPSVEMEDVVMANDPGPEVPISVESSDLAMPRCGDIGSSLAWWTVDVVSH